MALLAPRLGRAAAPRLFAAAVGSSSSSRSSQSGRRAFSAGAAHGPQRCAPQNVLGSSLFRASTGLPALARRAFASAAQRQAQPPPPPGGSKPDGGVEGVLRDMKQEVETKLGGTGDVMGKGKAVLREVQDRGEEVRHAAGSAGEQALETGQHAASALKHNATSGALQEGKEKVRRCAVRSAR